MTAQTPERFIMDGRPQALYADPLGPFLARHRIKPKKYASAWSTGCYRCYCGTWQVCDRRLYLVHLNLIGDCEEPIPQELRIKLLRAAWRKEFPIPAFWFSGRLRIAVGRRLVYSHHGWSSWFARERIITLIGGDVKRDREVDTRAILERARKRGMCGILNEAEQTALGPLIWLDESEDDWQADWWPADFPRPVSPPSSG